MYKRQDKLRKRLDAVRDRPVEWVLEEFAEGLNSVAAPVWSAATTRPPGDAEGVGEAVAAAAATISARLAGPIDPPTRELVTATRTESA